MTDPPEKPTNSSNFWVFCFLECPRLDFDADREYIKHATILITASYGSGLRNGTFSVIELVDIKTIGKGDVLGCCTYEGVAILRIEKQERTRGNFEVIFTQ